MSELRDYHCKGDHQRSDEQVVVVNSGVRRPEQQRRAHYPQAHGAYGPGSPGMAHCERAEYHNRRTALKIVPEERRRGHAEGRRGPNEPQTKQYVRHMRPGRNIWNMCCCQIVFPIPVRRVELQLVEYFWQ